jgi:hypothetical protein
MRLAEQHLGTIACYANLLHPIQADSFTANPCLVHEAPHQVPLIRAPGEHPRAWNENVECQRSTGRKMPNNGSEATAQVG